MDVIYLLLATALFAATAGLGVLCTRLMARKS
jgi:hypothetical protein